jgi:hypothetical protein
MQHQEMLQSTALEGLNEARALTQYFSRFKPGGGLSKAGELGGLTVRQVFM